MKLKTKEQLKEDGFIYISTNIENSMEVWAKFIGLEDVIQYIYHKEEVFTSDIQTISFGKVIMFEQMYRKMLQYPKVNQMGVLENVSEKWISINKI